MTDIVERLRLMAGPREAWEAADEIDRLRDVLREAREDLIDLHADWDIVARIDAALPAQRDDTALEPGEEWWMDVAGVPVKLDEWQPGAMKRSATDNGEER